jgi:hypothetical protein
MSEAITVTVVKFKTDKNIEIHVETDTARYEDLLTALRKHASHLHSWFDHSIPTENVDVGDKVKLSLSIEEDARADYKPMEFYINKKYELHLHRIGKEAEKPEVIDVPFWNLIKGSLVQSGNSGDHTMELKLETPDDQDTFNTVVAILDHNKTQ